MEQSITNDRSMGTVDSTFVHSELIRKKLLLAVLGSFWTALKVGLILLTFSGVVVSAKQYKEHLPTPIKLKMSADKLTVNQEVVQITNALRYLNCPKGRLASIAEGILKAAQTINVKPNLILAILFTESKFKLNAKSPLGYSGLMQTPRASMEYADVDILYGARILQEKMHDPRARGRDGKVDLRVAIALYKGGYNPMAFRQADAVLATYRKLNALNKEYA